MAASYEETMAILHKLGMGREDLETFSGRKKIQKIIYLMKSFGIDLRYGYTWYWHGPYSPQLTRTLFSRAEEDAEELPELSKDQLERLNQMRNFLSQDLYSSRSLELIVSLVYLVRNASKYGLNGKKQIVRFLRDKKPQFEVPEIEAALDKIVESGTWNKYLD